MRTAVLVFALVLGTAAWSGARLTTPSARAAERTALAPPAATTPVVAAPILSPPVSAGAEASSDPPSEPATTTEAAPPPSASAGANDSPVQDADDETSTPPESEPPEQPKTDAPTATPSTATTPTLEHVVAISLPPVAYQTFVDPAGSAPYLAGELAAQGALLRGYHATAPAPLATLVTLLSGQAPNATTLAGCVALTDLAPGTIGTDDQAAGTGCRYSKNVFTVGDLLASSSHTWKSYTDDPPASACATPPADGAAWPAQRAPELLFRSVSEAADCGTHFAGLADVGTDFASATAAPAFAHVAITGCAVGASCTTAAATSAADTALRTVIPAITASAAYGKTTAILILPTASPADAPTPDRSASGAKRPWQSPAVATAGGGRTGALLLSPLVRPGSVFDEPLDTYDALRTIATALDVRPPGLANRKEVTGLPREAWERWTPPTTSAADDDASIG